MLSCEIFNRNDWLSSITNVDRNLRVCVREKETAQSDQPLTNKPHFYSPKRILHYLPLSEREALAIMNLIIIKSHTRNNRQNPVTETYRITFQNLVSNKLFNFVLSGFENRHCCLSYTSQRLKYSRQMSLLFKHIHKPLQIF